uniref:Kinesin motor domain-containing protein n=1 Tax=Macrostomum lignano TaxID=282301 RepID=A0A1I8JRK5_9PLAT
FSAATGDASTQRGKCRKREKGTRAAPSLRDARESNSAPGGESSRLAEEFGFAATLSCRVRRRPTGRAQELAGDIWALAPNAVGEASAGRRRPAELWPRAGSTVDADLSQLEESTTRLAASARSHRGPSSGGRLARADRPAIGEPHLQPVKDARLLNLQAPAALGGGAGGCSGPLFVCCDAGAHEDDKRAECGETAEAMAAELLGELRSNWSNVCSSRWRENGADGANCAPNCAIFETRARRDCQALEERIGVEVRAERSGTPGQPAADRKNLQFMFYRLISHSSTTNCQTCYKIYHRICQGRISDLITARQSEETRRLATPNRQPSALAEVEARESTLRREARRSARSNRAAPSSKQRSASAPNLARHETVVAALREEARQKERGGWPHMEERIQQAGSRASSKTQLEQQRQAAEAAVAEAEAARARQAEAEQLAQRPAEQAAELQRALAASQQENSASRDQRVEAEALRRDLQTATGSTHRHSRRAELTPQKAELEATRRRVRELTVQLEEARTAARSATAANEAPGAAAATATTAAQAEAADWRASGAAASRRSCRLPGKQCRGERHADVIAHQKEALSELRRRRSKRLKAATAGHDQAVQQVVLPQEGAGRNCELSRPYLETDRFPRPVSDQVSEKAGHSANAGPAVASNLDLDQVQGLRSMAHLPRDNAEAGKRTRRDGGAAEPSTANCSRSGLDTEGRLLSGCEQDMKILILEGSNLEGSNLEGSNLEGSNLERFQLEGSTEGFQPGRFQPGRFWKVHLATSRLETLTEDLRTRTEETQLLRRKSEPHQRRAQPGETAQHGHQQKKETFHMERAAEPAVGGKRPGRRPGSEQFERNFRRKDYEIKTLKAELISKEKNLSSASERLANSGVNAGLTARIRACWRCKLKRNILPYAEAV